MPRQSQPHPGLFIKGSIYIQYLGTFSIYNTFIGINTCPHCIIYTLNRVNVPRILGVSQIWSLDCDTVTFILSFFLEATSWKRFGMLSLHQVDHGAQSGHISSPLYTVVYHQHLSCSSMWCMSDVGSPIRLRSVIQLTFYNEGWQPSLRRAPSLICRVGQGSSIATFLSALILANPPHF